MTLSVRRVLLGLKRPLLFPRDVATVDLEHELNLKGFERIQEVDNYCVAAFQRELASELAPEHLLEVGTLARVVSTSPLPGGGQRIVLQGIRRVHIHRAAIRDGHLSAVTNTVLTDFESSGETAEDLGRLARNLVALGELDSAYSVELAEMIPLYGDDLERITDLAASVLPLPRELRTHLLVEPDPLVRLERINDYLEADLDRRRTAPTHRPEQSQRSAPRVRTVQAPKLWAHALAHDEGDEEVERIARLIETTKLPELATEVLHRELDHLRHAPPYTPESPRIRTYLEWCLELPWKQEPRCTDVDRFDRVTEKLAASHVGLDDVKQRIAEFLAVRQLGGGARGTVLCFLGPPGTGKSSMGRAVAEALGRRMLSISVGAIMHERELVGVSHRRQGATPGAILTGLHRCGTSNPVILLDEIDKVSLGGEGTAAGALLSLLDPEQNGEFLDHYLGVPFDLSRCLFLATAIDADEIPEALLDRMEIIEFNSYIESEKYVIGRRHLLPRARAHAGIDKSTLRLSPAALRTIIRAYTEEAGVRQLQRVLMSLARKAALEVVRGGEGLSVNKSDLGRSLGPRTVDEELGLRRPAVGVATGLAWTSAGGALLPIEALAIPGSGNLILTGQIGDIMRESVQTAISYVRTRFKSLGLRSETLDEVDIHLHFPSAATPKDGPSAGVAIAAALVSLLTGRPVRHDVALTGELSLLGSVLPVGGVREKLLAAIRGGIPEVVVPTRNAEEILRLPAEIKNQVTVHLVEDVEAAIQLALVEQARPTAHTTSLRQNLRKVARRAKKRDRDAG